MMTLDIVPGGLAEQLCTDQQMQLSFPLLLRGVACAYDFRWVVNYKNEFNMEHYQLDISLDFLL